MKYPSTAAREARLLAELEKRGILVFNPVEVSNILQVGRESAHRIMSRMVSKGLVRRLERGKYVASSALKDRDIYELACQVVQPSYLSLWSGLHAYGYTSQVPKTVYLMVAIPRSGLELQGRNLRFVRTRHFFGYKREGKIIIAEPEKLFLDCLAFPEHAGGIAEIREALDAAGLDCGKLRDYAMLMGNKSLNSRLGYILEESGKGFDAEPLRDMISSSYVPLDPARPNIGRRSKRWKLTLNIGGC